MFKKCNLLEILCLLHITAVFKTFLCRKMYKRISCLASNFVKFYPNNLLTPPAIPNTVVLFMYVSIASQ